MDFFSGTFGRHSLFKYEEKWQDGGDSKLWGDSVVTNSRHFWGGQMSPFLVIE